MGSSAGRATESDVVVDFGVLSMTVSLYTGESTVEKNAVKMRNCCPECYDSGKGDAVGVGVRYHCEHGHGPFETSDVIKGTEGDGDILTIVGTSSEVKEQRAESVELEKKHVELEFMSADEVLENFYPADKTWVAQPKKTQPLFSALMEILGDDGVVRLDDGREVVAVGQIRMRDSEHVVRLSKWGDQLVFQKLYRPEDCKVFPTPMTSEVSEKNVTMIKSLIGTMVTEFDPETYSDQARRRLVAWKTARSTGVTVNVAPKKASKDPNADLEAMLEAALEAAKEKAS
jgi:non-homologous end joining protein Ku